MRCIHSILLCSAVAALSACSSSGGDGGTELVGNTVDGVACAINSSSFNSSAKVNATSTVKWSCTSTTRTMTGNGIPDHPVTTANPGYALNSVKFDPATAGTCASNATSINPGGGCVAAMGADP